MFGLQYSHILYEFGIIDMYIRPDWLPYLLSIIPSLYIAFSPLKDYHHAFGYNTVFQTITVFLLGVTAFFSFFADDNFFGVINIVTAIIYAIVFCREEILELDNVFTWSPFFIIAVNLMYFVAEYEIGLFFWIAFVLLCFSGYFGASFFIVLGLTYCVSYAVEYWWDLVDWVDWEFGIAIGILCIISGIVLFKKMFERRN